MKMLAAIISLVALIGAAKAPETIQVGEQDLQQVIDAAPPHSTIVANRNREIEITRTITIDKPVTLVGLNARLQHGLVRTPILSVIAEGVRIRDFHLTGNADSVPQEGRAPLIEVRRGRFVIENGETNNSSKDGVMITPLPEYGDIEHGVVRNITSRGTIRDTVSIGGVGEQGLFVRHLVVENIRAHDCELRGAVEVSDGSEYITVRDVYAESCYYGVDIQDHGQEGQVNRHVIIDGLHVKNTYMAVRTANHDFGHDGLTIRNVTGTDWPADAEEPFQVRNTSNVLIDNVRLHGCPIGPCMRIRNSDNVTLRDITFVDGGHDGPGLRVEDGNNVLIDNVTISGESGRLESYELSGNMATVRAEASMTVGADFVAGNLIRFTGAADNPNGAWCWFQDERVIVDDEHPDEPVLMFTSVSASKEVEAEQGDLDFHWYGLVSRSGGTIEFHDRFGQDDHNVAALFQLDNGQTMAVYARHNKDTNTYSRRSAPHRPDVWDDANVYEGEAKATYNNLLTAGVGSEQKLLSFSRLQGWDPNFLAYDAKAGTWRYGGRLLNSEGRPYLKYAGSADGTKIHVVATDQHPRNYDNSIYHGVTDGSVLFNSVGDVLDPNLSDQDAVEPSELTVVFAGDADNVAWMTDVAIDQDDQPVIAFSVQKDGRDKPQGSGGLDHRYHLASYTPEGWQQQEIAFAGERLYPREDDYTGLVAIDPQDVDYLVISTNADPASGAPLISSADGKRHYELFAGRMDDADKPIAWQALTRNSTVDNIRPVIPAWDSNKRVVLWMRGSYTTYMDFDTQIVGIVQTR